MKQKAVISLAAPEVVQRHLAQQVINGVIDNNSLRNSTSTASSTLSNSSDKRIMQARQCLASIPPLAHEDFKQFEVVLHQTMDSTPRLEWKNQHLTLTKEVELITHTVKIASIRLKKHCLIIIHPRKSLLKSILGGSTKPASYSRLGDDPCVVCNYLSYLDSGLPVLALPPNKINGIVLAFDHRSERASWLNELTRLLNTVPLDTAHLFELPTRHNKKLPEILHRPESNSPPQLAPSPFFKTHGHNNSASSCSTMSVASLDTDASTGSCSPQYVYTACLQTPPSFLSDRKYTHTLFDDIRKVSPLNLPLQSPKILPGPSNMSGTLSSGKLSLSPSTAKLTPPSTSPTNHRLAKYKSTGELRERRNEKRRIISSSKRAWA